MSDNSKKRSQKGEDGPGKKRKNYPQSQSRSSGPAIPSGVQGILVTCEGGRERRSGDEVVAMVEEALERIGASGKPQQPAGDAAAANEAAAPPAGEGDAAGSAAPAPPAPKQGNIEDLLAAEVADLKDKRKDRFRWHDTGVRGTFFLSFPNESGLPGPVEVVRNILQVAKDTLHAPGRFTLRLLPVTHTCFAGLEEIKALAPKVVEPHFSSEEGADKVDFAVEFDHRASDKLDRMKVIDAIIAPIKQPPHKVNLKTPAKTILVQLVRGVCACSVVEQFKELSKFNVSKVAEPPEEAAEGAKAAAG